MKASMRRTATIDYRISRVPVLCKDCRQDVGLYPARHVCSNSKDSAPPLPIVDLRAVATRSAGQPQPINTYDDVSISATATETVERAKVVVGRGWEAVRNMNWKDMTKKEPESNSPRMWGRLIQATSTARQKVADKYYEVREGGNESDDDTPDNTHTQRVLAQYYLGTEGALPPWLNPPSSLAALSATNSHRPSASSASSSSGSSMHRGGSKPVSLQDIYDSARPNQQFNPQSRTGRTPDLYASDQSTSGRQALAGDRLRNKLRPSNSRPLNQSGSNGDQDVDDSGFNRGSGGYSGRSGFGGGDEYDPYNYQQQSGYDSNRSRQGQYGGLPNRPGGRR